MKPNRVSSIDPTNSMIDIDHLLTGDYYIRCMEPGCEFQSGNITIGGSKTPPGFCACRTGKCFYYENKIKDCEPDLRVIIRR